MPLSSASGVFLGVGVSAGAVPAEAIALMEEALMRSGLQHRQTLAIATIASRRGNAALLAAASHFGCDIVYFDAGELEAQTPRLKNPSEALFARIGCHGVAEAAALAAAGTDATLILEKLTDRHVTVAIAISHAVF
jgi:cobalamin biosynthesis protein CbiG